MAVMLAYDNVMECNADSCHHHGEWYDKNTHAQPLTHQQYQAVSAFDWIDYCQTDKAESKKVADSSKYLPY